MRTTHLLITLLLLTFTLGCQDESPPQVKIPPQSAQKIHIETSTTPAVTEEVIALTEEPREELAPKQPDEGKETIQDKTVNEVAATSPKVDPTPPQPDEDKETIQDMTVNEVADTSTQVDPTPPQPGRKPPQPPVAEDFQGAPKLTLFPRVGDYQPATESEHYSSWRSLIDSLVAITGVAENQEDGTRGWVFRGIEGTDSVGYFAPLKAEPNKTYQVSFKLSAELPKDVSAGISILEFDKFLWIGGQYHEEAFKKHYRGAHEGKRLTDKVGGAQTFTFTTGPETGMIHLLLFREGPHDRNSLMFDDIEIK